MVVVFLAGLAGVVTMARRLGRAGGVTRAIGRREPAVPCVGPRGALWSALAVESLGQRRYRADCDADAAAQPGSAAAGSSMPRRCGASSGCWPPRSSTTAWPSSGSRPPARPSRSGIRSACSAPSPASCSSTGRRCSSSSASGATSGRSATRRAADWTFLALLWITGVTGFAIEIALYLPSAPVWGYWVFLFHVAVAMELVLLAPFMKFAHAVYRPVALFFLALAQAPDEASTGAADA